MTLARSPLLLAAMIGSLAACSSTPISPTAPVATGAPAPVAAASPTTAAAGARAGAAGAASTVATVNLPAYLDPANRLSTDRSVYFDYDQFTVKSDYAALIERHGRYLASHPALAIRIEGNSDERGGTEYNLALGQKRAEATLRALRIYGAKEQQMEAVSWGEAKPKSTAQDEAAWAQNRRADLQYPRQ